MNRTVPAPNRKRVLFLALAFVAAGSVLFVKQSAAQKMPRFFFGPKVVVPFQQVPKGVDSLSAKACKKCHEEIYNQWSKSMHAKAWVDPVWLAGWENFGRPPFCHNCHIPLANQKPKMLVGFRDKDTFPPVHIYMNNPNFSAELFKEGITCAVCHIRDGMIYGPFEIPQEKSPHPVAYSPEHKQAEFCYSCHEFAFPRFQIHPMIDTPAEYKEKFRPKDERTCQECHMPGMEGPIATGGEKREWRMHSWQGGNNIEYLKEAVAMAVEKDKESYGPGETAKINVKLVNTGAGHMFPTGDPNRAVYLQMTVLDDAGRKVAYKESRIMRQIEMFMYPTEIVDNRLAPGEARDFPFVFKVPPGGRVSLKVELLHYLQYPKRAAEIPYPVDKLKAVIYSQVVPLTQ
ncbi:MAG: hypothetical protein HYU64_01675 [Armatimonadetes bacterium]|nr:hypothetical protein [Armatimonadota bacterium]